LLRDLKIENLSNNENHTKEYFPVKTLCFEKQSNILLVGDETGYVKAFNIKEYIDYLKLMLPCAKIEYSDIAHIQSTSKEISPELKKLKEELLKAPKYDATKEEGFKYTISLGDLIRIKNSMNLEPILEKEWLAHKHGITSVCCHSEPVFFVTAGHDMKVHIWNRKFERIGSLITMTDPKWNVKINIEEERRKAREEAKEKFYALKDLDYESLFEGETKLPRLIDDD
jgi:WD40 repeat protein